jgi:hypothetical protein
MAAEVAQTYESHRRFVPLFHFAGWGILLLNLLWAVFRLYRAIRWEHSRFDIVNDAVNLLVAFALLILIYYIRSFVLTVQDRVIRAEVAERLRRLLPPDLVPRIGELHLGQFIALRFAGDAELGALTRKVLDEHIRDRDAIKRLVKDWQPDHLRA